MIYAVITLLAALVLFLFWATGPDHRKEADLAAYNPNADLFWNIVRRGIVSAFYGFSLLHSPLIFMLILISFMVPAALVGILAGFLNGVLVGWITVGVGRRAPIRRSLPFYLAIVCVGVVAYAGGGFTVVSVIYSGAVIDKADFLSFAALWSGLCGILGAVVSGRLGHWVAQQPVCDTFSQQIEKGSDNAN